jgi:hypothetical protein
MTSLVDYEIGFEPNQEYSRDGCARSRKRKPARENPQEKTRKRKPARENPQEKTRKRKPAP